MSYYQKYQKYKKKYTNLQMIKSKVQMGGQIKNISGPASIWIGDYDQNRYILMGDVHFDITSGICPSDCMKIEDIQSKEPAFVNYSENSYILGNKVGSDNTCYEITRLLDEIFNEALKTKQYIDFYHEIPFIHKEQKEPTNVRSIYGSYLNKIDTYFSKCFLATKENCEWKNYVRFHYTDIRMDYRRKEQIFSTADPISVIQHVPSMVLNLPIKDNTTTLTILEDTVMDQIVNHNYIVLMLQTYEKFNRIIFDSTNYTKDISDYFQDIYNEMKAQCSEEYILNKFKTQVVNLEKKFLQQVKIVNSSDKTMNTSFIKKQMDELAKDNKFVYDKLVEYKNNQIKEMNIRLADIFKHDRKFLYVDSTKLKSELMAVTDLNNLNVIISLLNEDLFTAMPIFKSLKNRGLWAFTIFKYGTFYMDIYLISRLFRQFTSSGTHIPSKTKIIYAGAIHIQNYIEFFQSYLNVSPEKFVGLNDFTNNDVIRKASRCLESPYPEIKDFIKPISNKEVSLEEKNAMSILDSLKKNNQKFCFEYHSGSGNSAKAKKYISEIDKLRNQLENQKQYIPYGINDDLNKVLKDSDLILGSHKCEDPL